MMSKGGLGCGVCAGSDNSVTDSNAVWDCGIVCCGQIANYVGVRIRLIKSFLLMLTPYSRQAVLSQGIMKISTMSFSKKSTLPKEILKFYRLGNLFIWRNLTI